ncbi:MAG: hypothetical protein Q7J84_18525, partial [Sulfuricaulis sp.]|nr:hypothetical protein [Sulfuricaulis sp.]
MLTYRKEIDKRHVQHAPGVCLLKEGYVEIARDIVAYILAAGCNAHRAYGTASLDPERITCSIFAMHI